MANLERRTSELIYQGRKSRVLRVSYEGQPVVLKILSLPYPTHENLACFRHEHAVTVSLSAIDGVIRCAGLTRYEESIALILEEMGGISLDRLITTPHPPYLPWLEVLQISILLASTLVRVHATGIIHKDITPANLLWNRQMRELRLIDFGIADRLPEENIEGTPPALLEGTLRYMAPEQTGRMNRPVDLRSDLYALGATLYHLLTGYPPFPTTDPVELVACHLAKVPRPIHLGRPEIPEMFSCIVAKLMAKEPMERYQSAIGLEKDLRHCLEAWNQHGEIPAFTPARHDRVEILRFPCRLYGREQELSILRTLLAQACRGESHLLLLAGTAGMGKSILAMELRPHVAASRGRFASGKFGLIQQSRPMAAVMEVIEDLCRQRMADADALFDQWQQQLRMDLGMDLTLLARTLPQIAPLFQHEGIPPELSPSETAIRLRHILLVLLRSLTEPERPLVVVLDDLQWADQMSLELINDLLADAKSTHLLVVGTYRDDETPTSHPLKKAVSRWQEKKFPLSTLHLNPLSVAATSSFLTATLDHSPATLAPLVQLLHTKTGGNPFDLRTFLTALHLQKLLRMEEGKWCWDLEVIQTHQVAKSVAARLLDRLQGMDQEQRDLIARAAYLGHWFNLLDLITVSNQPTDTVILTLEQLLATGLLLPMRGARRLARWLATIPDDIRYRFAHDQVQEAALALVLPSQRPQFRLELGRRLYAVFTHTEIRERYFLLADQFCDTTPEMLDPDERPQIAQLLLDAGQQANQSAAFATARQYFEKGMLLLGEEGWQWHYDLALALHNGAGKCAGIAEDLERVEALRTDIAAHADSFTHLCPILTYLAPLYLPHSMFGKILELGHFVLHQFGYPTHLTPNQLTRQHRYVQQLLIARYADTTPEFLAAMPVLSRSADLSEQSHWLLPILLTIHFANPRLASLIASIILLRMLQEECLINDAASYFVWVGSSLIGGGTCDKAVTCGYRFGQAAELIFDRGPQYFPEYFNDIHIYRAFLSPWKQPLQSVCQALAGDYIQAMNRGAIFHAGTAISVLLMFKIDLGEPLETYKQECQDWLPILTSHGTYFGMLAELIKNTSLAAVAELRSETEATWRLKSEQDVWADLSMNANMAIFHFLQAGKNAFLFREYDQAAQQMALTKQQCAAQGNIRPILALVLFYESLSSLALLPSATTTERRRLLRLVATNQKQLARWAQHNSAHFLHLDYLVKAACRRAFGHPEQALPLCEAAVAAIRAQSGEVWMQYEAMALEMAGECLLDMKSPMLASSMLHRAILVWSRYGATAKEMDLVQRYREVLEEWPERVTGVASSSLDTATTSDRQKGEQMLDYPTLLKATQSVASGEGVREVVIRLLEAVLANTGAERGCLIWLQEEHLVLAAEGWQTTGIIQFFLDDPHRCDHHHTVPPAVPMELIRYVFRSGETVLLAEAPTDARWGGSFRDQRVPRSVLCVPLRHSGAFLGALYLEHGGASGVFSPQRLETVTILGAQAVVSLVNAQMLASEQRATMEIRRLGNHLDQAAETEKKRIAGEVHDELGGTLAAIRIALTQLEKYQTSPDTKQRCREIAELAHSAQQTVRRIATSLRPPVLDHFGLHAALKWMADQVAFHSGLEVTLSQEITPILDDGHATALFRIGQEAVTNAVRHAQASQIRIDLRITEELEQKWVVLTVTDNGVGFLPLQQDGWVSFGISGMRERAKRLGGSLTIGTVADNCGTQIVAKIPSLE
ncbi:MAG: AAA family ATPase [Magnetococcales bacterium]|nr:AAA family ATPase [Magnetococcales bacterium]